MTGWGISGTTRYGQATYGRVFGVDDGPERHRGMTGFAAYRRKAPAETTAKPLN
jgi:hypothetical protein